MKKNPNRVEKSDGSGIVFVWLRVCVCVYCITSQNGQRKSTAI